MWTSVEPLPCTRYSSSPGRDLRCGHTQFADVEGEFRRLKMGPPSHTAILDITVLKYLRLGSLQSKEAALVHRCVPL